MELILGIDIGSTAIKSVIFDISGKEICCSMKLAPTIKQRGGIIERDLDDVWIAAAAAVKESLGTANEFVPRIAAIGISGAGDGLALLDINRKPVRNSITSLDTRTSNIIQQWHTSGVMEKIFPIIGEIPFPGTSVALLRWLKEYEPGNYKQAKYILFIKDWIKYKLTGEICTDRTDASSTLTDLSGHYNESIFQILDIEESFHKTIPIEDSCKIIGFVTGEAAILTGLKQGTPVVSGVHDCSASALGTGCVNSGQTCLITGTWSGNEAVSNSPITDDRTDKYWLVRNYVLPETWLLMSSSPASGANLEWFVNNFKQSILRGIDTSESSIYRICDDFVKRSRNDEFLLFQPFLYGSFLDAQAGAGFLGIRPWHKIEDFLRALYEGIVFNHCHHLKELSHGITVGDIRICGGGSKSDIWMQIFADALESTIQVPNLSEVSALGAAIVASVGAGIYEGYKAACKNMTGFNRCFEPNSQSTKILNLKRDIYELAYTQMMPVWNMIRQNKSNEK